ncbi:MAG: tyrosine-type recombinase/integrase [Pseudomonadales bacterium]|nr:tyrosine-type recombinase/integrase [Pseudomonadales bacterium]
MVDNLHPQYTFIKRNTYYFSKAVPLDLRCHYTKPRIVQSLHTKSQVKAKTASLALAAKLEDYWLGLRLRSPALPCQHFLISERGGASDLLTVIEALDQYLLVKGKEKTPRFDQSAKRNIKYLTDCLGIRAIDEYSSSDASKLRDWLLERKLSPTTLLRIFGGIKAVFNFTILENGFDTRNPFAGVYLPTANAEKRHTISNDNIRIIQQACTNIDDDIRWLVALISDTGMRLAEATGLLVEDINIFNEIPYVSICPHPHRRLKTVSSNRIIPLVGASLWAARQLKASGNKHCFPRYSNEQKCNSNSASASVNKWLKTVSNEMAVVHGMRHSFRDRMRSIEAPNDMIDQIGGWSLKTIGQGYGDGYQLEQTQRWLKRITLDVEFSTQPDQLKD